MAIRKFTALVAVLLTLICAQAAKLKPWTFSFYPVNTYDTDSMELTEGLVLYFEGAPAPTASVTVDAIQDGKQICDTQTIETVHAEYSTRTVFQLRIDEAHRHEIQRIEIDIAGRRYTIKGAKSGVEYKFPR